MSSQRASSSKQWWKDHKPTILALAENHTMKDVKKMMENAHGLEERSLNQYEYHLRKWGLQKNIDTKHWRKVVQVYDALAERYGEVQVLVRGEALSSAALEKKRRRYAPQRGASTNAGAPVSIPQIVSFQARKSDGQWTFVAESELRQEAGAHATLAPPPRHIELHPALAEHHQAGPGDSPGPSQQAREIAPSKAPGEGASTAAEQSHTITLASDGSPAELAQLSQTPHACPSTPDDAALEPPGAPSACVSSPRAWRVRDEIPKALAIRERLHSPCPQSAPEFLATQLESLFSPIEKRLWGSQTFQVFFRGASPTGLHQGHLTFAPEVLLQPLRTLLPDARFGYIDGHYSLNVCLFRRLLFALANGYPGLESAGGAEITRILGGSTGGAALFSQILANARGGYGLAIAESLLKAAICAKNADAVRSITRASTVNITKIRFAGGFTALNQAAFLGDPNLFMAVLSSGEFDENARSNVDLSRIRWGPCPDAEEIASLIRKESLWDLNRIFRSLFHDNPQLAHRVIIGMSPAQAVQLDYSNFHPLFEQLRETQLVELLPCILKGYSTGTKSDQLRHRLLAESLKIPAKRGLIKVFELLLPRAPFNVLLNASIKSGNRNLVVFILSQKSGMGEPLQDLDNNELWDGLVHPLAEAIRSRDDEIIRLIEEAEPLETFYNPKHVVAVLRAAASVGHEGYFRKLMHRQPPPSTHDLYDILVDAIGGNRESISLALLESGAAARARLAGPPRALGAAIHNRNRRIVDAILEHGCGANEFDFDDSFLVWRELIEWGDFDLIIKLKSAFPPLMATLKAWDPGFSDNARPFDDPTFRVIPNTFNEEVLQFLGQHNLVAESQLRCVLKNAMAHKNERLAYLAIELGADPVDPDVLHTATSSYPQFLPVLLRQVPRAVLEYLATSPVAKQAIWEAIFQGPLGLPALKCLFDSGIASIHSLERFSRLTIDPGWINTPGLAIEQSIQTGRVNLTTVQFFLDLGWNPDSIVGLSPEGNPMTALILAISTRNVALVKLLIDRGATVNTSLSPTIRFTPLQKAAEMGDLDIVKLLLSQGADVNAAPAVCARGTALQMAAISGNCSVIVELLKHNADIYMPPSRFDGRWPLEGAAEHGRISAIQFLWKWRRGCFNDRVCERAMELAEKEGHMGCVQLIKDLRAEKVKERLEDTECWMVDGIQGGAEFGLEDFSL
ncbi:hypothetical protein MAPG_01848 [Magnaporthiopsis poae ATCC 64411]|uniref:Clr5 domain-containing protein n=1 Tax=Magnaporthiopsis poae (strain ATCC 64411 / 73-15) TaxID=644358 RepID=A0A0C4DPS6_MAGP6|nr:hypothetical protein MAPG_01848 [Magnaporthiopsis poae ATCC 64411]